MGANCLHDVRLSGPVDVDEDDVLRRPTLLQVALAVTLVAHGGFRGKDGDPGRCQVRLEEAIKVRVHQLRRDARRDGLDYEQRRRIRDEKITEGYTPNGTTRFDAGSVCWGWSERETRDLPKPRCERRTPATDIVLLVEIRLELRESE